MQSFQFYTEVCPLPFCYEAQKSIKTQIEFLGIIMAQYNGRGNQLSHNRGWTGGGEKGQALSPFLQWNDSLY